MSRGPEIGTLVTRNVEQAARRYGCGVRVQSVQSTRWASATFNGERHRLQASAAPSPALDKWLAELGDADFSIRGHLVADIHVRSIQRAAELVGIELEVLTLEDA